jgi:hypothetical protein
MKQEARLRLCVCVCVCVRCVYLFYVYETKMYICNVCVSLIERINPGSGET